VGDVIFGLGAGSLVGVGRARHRIDFEGFNNRRWSWWPRTNVRKTRHRAQGMPGKVSCRVKFARVL